MKLTKDNLNEFYISNRGNLRRNGITWKISECIICGEYFLAQVGAINKGLGKYCTPECKNESMIGEGNHFFGRKHTQETKDLIGYKNSLYERKKGKDNPNFGRKHTIETRLKHKNNHKSGVYDFRKKCGIEHCWYDTYEPQLSPYGVECRRSIDDRNILEVKCHLHSCGNWFKPNKYQSRMKISALNGKGGEHNLYCSDGCKKLCPTFGIHTDWVINSVGNNGRDFQYQLRQMVFERDDYTCQECGQRGGSFHCHHITPINESPITSADIDNCITLCENCHKLKHKIKDCRYYDLRC